jgi:hypothetical protein
MTIPNRTVDIITSELHVALRGGDHQYPYDRRSPLRGQEEDTAR